MTKLNLSRHTAVPIELVDALYTNSFSRLGVAPHFVHHFTHNSCALGIALPQSFSDPSPVKDHSQHTIGVEFSSRTVKLGEKRIKLQVRKYQIEPSTGILKVFTKLWDTAGQERFRSVMSVCRQCY